MKHLLKSITPFMLAPLFLALFLIFPAGAPAAGDTLNLKKGVKVGSGKTMVIEFTDPDCPFCQKAEAYFQGKPQVTRYIFFLPLKSHPGSKEKVQYILSAKDRERAYLEVVSGKFDQKKLSAITPEGIKLQKEHQEIAKEHGMKSTPTFMIFGRVIVGFDVNKIEPLLKDR